MTGRQLAEIKRAEKTGGSLFLKTRWAQRRSSSSTKNDTMTGWMLVNVDTGKIWQGYNGIIKEARMKHSHTKIFFTRQEAVNDIPVELYESGKYQPVKVTINSRVPE